MRANKKHGDEHGVPLKPQPTYRDFMFKAGIIASIISLAIVFILLIQVYNSGLERIDKNIHDSLPKAQIKMANGNCLDTTYTIEEYNNVQMLMMDMRIPILERCR